VVSHDQEFLNQVVTDIIDIVQLKLYYYKGSPGEVYHTFKKVAASRRKEAIKQAEKERKQAVKDQKAAAGSNKGGAKAKDKDKGQAGGGSDGAAAGPIKDYVVTFSFPEPPPLPLPIIAADHLSFGYTADRPLFDDLSTAVTMDSRIAIVGPNGSGKSTLFKLLTRELLPDKGEVRHNGRLKLGVYKQHFIDQLPNEPSPVKLLEGMFPEEGPQQVRKCLGMFGLPSHAHQTKIKALSGGQKARVLFAQIALMRPDVIFLDEPTNHLDIESIDALQEAIKAYKGGVVLVTHDARLLVETGCDLWVCGDCDPAKKQLSTAQTKKGNKHDAGSARAATGDDPDPFSGAKRFDGNFSAYAAHILQDVEWL